MTRRNLPAPSRASPAGRISPGQVPAASVPLFGVITVHCCFCPAARVGVTPLAAHDAMEAHYAAAHAKLITSLVTRFGWQR